MKPIVISGQDFLRVRSWGHLSGLIPWGVAEGEGKAFAASLQNAKEVSETVYVFRIMGASTRGAGFLKLFSEDWNRRPIWSLWETAVALAHSVGAVT
jgi:hypothetical protein